MQFQSVIVIGLISTSCSTHKRLKEKYENQIKQLLCNYIPEVSHALAHKDISLEVVLQ